MVSDRSFYQTSGGGVTLSGGEPLLQRGLRPGHPGALASAEGIHTAIETCANCRWQDLASLLPFTDLVMMDLKHMDAARHRAVTGVSNERILANAERLMQTPFPCSSAPPSSPPSTPRPMRLPPSPASCAAWAPSAPSGTGRTGPRAAPMLELLPFHKLAGDKFRSLGRDDPAAGLTPLSRQQMQELAAVARGEGIEVKLR